MESVICAVSNVITRCGDRDGTAASRSPSTCRSAAKAESPVVVSTSNTSMVTGCVKREPAWLIRSFTYGLSTTLMMVSPVVEPELKIDRQRVEADDRSHVDRVTAPREEQLGLGAVRREPRHRGVELDRIERRVEHDHVLLRAERRTGRAAVVVLGARGKRRGDDEQRRREQRAAARALEACRVIINPTILSGTSCIRE